MRLLCAAALALSCGLWLAYGDDKNPTQVKAERVARFADIKTKFEASFKALEGRFEKAATEGEKRGVAVEMRELTLLTAGEAIKVAEVAPGDEVGFDVCAFILRSAERVGAGGPDVAKAVDFVTEHHAASPKVKDVLPYVFGKSGNKLLKAVTEKGADNDTKAVALVLRGFQAINAIDETEDAEIVAEVRAATELLEAARKLAPGAKIDDTPVAEFVDRGLAALKKITGLMPGNPAPKVESQTLDGKKATLDDHKGKVVVLDFWSTRCEPCKEMIPHQRELVNKYKGRPFALVSVSGDQEKKTLQGFLEKESMPWHHWWHEDSQAFGVFRIQATPTVYLIDHAGVIRYRATGEIDDKKLDKLIDELVVAAEKPKG